MLGRLRLQLLGRMPGKLRLRVRIGLYGILRHELRGWMRKHLQRLWKQLLWRMYGLRR